VVAVVVIPHSTANDSDLAFGPPTNPIAILFLGRRIAQARQQVDGRDPAKRGQCQTRHPATTSASTATGAVVTALRQNVRSSY
jgi:hypothetical protein